jgi:hypothetical protein
VTRQLIERQLDAMQRRLPSRAWLPYALVTAGLIGGLVLARVPVLRLLRIGARSVHTGVTVASAAAAMSRFLGAQRRRSARPLAAPRRSPLRRAS